MKLTCFALCAVLTGCSTIQTLRGDPLGFPKPMSPPFPHYLPQGATVPRVLSGTAMNLRDLVAWRQGAWTCFQLLDVPLSLAVDLVISPYTLAMQITAGSYRSTAAPVSFLDLPAETFEGPLVSPGTVAGEDGEEVWVLARDLFVDAVYRGCRCEILRRRRPSGEPMGAVLERHWIPLQTDGDVADLYQRRFGELHPSLSGELSSDYREFWSVLVR